VTAAKNPFVFTYEFIWAHQIVHFFDRVHEANERVEEAIAKHDRLLFFFFGKQSQLEKELVECF